MVLTSPVAGPPPFKSRRGWLIVFGVVEILMGCTFLLILALSAFVFLGPAAARMPSSGIPRGAILAFVGIEYLVLAGIFFTGGIGSLRCKNWARIFMLVVSGLWLGFGILTLLMMVFLFPIIMRQQPGNVPPGIQHGIIVVMIAVMSFLMVLLPAAFLFFYSRKSVKATCLAQKAAQAPTLAEGGSPAAGFPVPLAILGAWEAFSAFSVLAVLFVRVTIVFGVVVHGAGAALILLTCSVLSGYAAWAIFRQRLIGWQIALFMAGFWTVSMVVTLLRHPDVPQLFREVGYNEQTLHIYEQLPQLLPVIWVGTIVMMTALLVFILYTRKYFPTEEQA